MQATMSRRALLAAIAKGAVARSVGGLGFTQLPNQPSDDHRNLLFLMTVQHNASVLGWYGNPIVRTPNLDRLAADGVRFSSASCPTPFCSPTRASLVTGWWPHQHGITQNVDGDARGVTDAFTIIENLLFDPGDKTAYRGKRHLGPYADVCCYRDDKPEGRGWGRLLEEVCPAADYPSREGKVRLFGRPVIMQDFISDAHRIWNTYDNIPPQDISIIGRAVIPREGMLESCYTERVLRLDGKTSRQPLDDHLVGKPPSCLLDLP